MRAFRVSFLALLAAVAAHAQPVSVQPSLK